MPTQGSHREHIETSQEAGFNRVSLVSLLAGLLTAYGTFAVVAAIAGAVLNANDAETEFRTNDWTGSGAVASLASAVVLLVAYLFGGYVAGRMARRAGVLHGVLVFVASLITGAVVGVVVGVLTDNEDVKDNLRSIGLPTSVDQIEEVAVVGAVVSLIAMLVGSVLGGALGERWHDKLARRAADPSIGPAAEARARDEREDDERRRRIEHDENLRREGALVQGDEQDGRRRVLHDEGPRGEGEVGPRQGEALDSDDPQRRQDDIFEDSDEPRYTAAEWQQQQQGSPAVTQEGPPTVASGPGRDRDPDRPV